MRKLNTQETQNVSGGLNGGMPPIKVVVAVSIAAAIIRAVKKSK